MSFKTRIVTLVLAALAFLPVAASAAKPQPFVASFQFVELIGDPLPPNCALTGDIAGVGAITQPTMVPTTFESDDCINVLSPTTFGFTSTNVVMTTSAGDKIYASYAGVLNPATGQITGAYVITGGTGVYKSATGAGTISGGENLATGEGAIMLNGMIRY